jgi:hypothetical protein
LSPITLMTHQDPMQALVRATSAFQRVRGFEQRYLMATLRPVVLPTSPRGEILRAIQCEERGTYALVRLYGARERDWVSRYRRALTNAGYSEKSSPPGDNEVALTRWVSGRHALVREMGLLAQLKEDRELPRRPKAPKPTRRRRRSVREWGALFRTIQDAQLPIELCAVTFSRYGKFYGERKGTYVVTAVAVHDVGHRPSIHILVSVSGVSVVATKVMRVLEARGYARSKYSSSYCVAKTVRPVPLAVRECERVFLMFAREVPRVR